MLKTIQPIRSEINHTVDLPGSKSMVNRALIMASLANGTSRLSNMLFSDDSKACMSALQALGVKLQINELTKEVLVEGVGHLFPNKKADIYCHDAGTVTRFMLPVCAANQGEFSFSASKRMSERPIGELLAVLQAQGTEIKFHEKTNQMPLTLIANGLKGGDIFIESKKSTQFLSGLLMALPLAASDTNLKTKANKKLTYVEMTAQMLQAFGITVNQLPSCNGYQIKANQTYQSCDYTIEPDISTASYFAAAAALTSGTVTILHVKRSSLQGDVVFFDVLEKMGCQIDYHNQGVTVKGTNKLQGVSVDMSSFSDTFMTLAAIASFAEGKTTITGIWHTRLQESDRILAIQGELEKLGAKIESTDDSITIYPQKLHGGRVSGCNDHRVAMSLSLVGLKVSGVEIEGYHCVSKTCPDYFDRLEALG